MSELTLLFPEVLVLLAIIPLLAAYSIWVQRRRRKESLRFSSLALVRPALSQQSKLRRFVPPALFLFALVCLAVALARPAANVRSPIERATVILALDISVSMNSGDIPPSRMAAAKAASRSFLRLLNPNTQTGVVAFSTYADLIQPPTTNQAALEVAIDSLAPGGRTAIGSGIEASLSGMPKRDSPENQAQGTVSSSIPVTGDTRPAEIIVLLTDGVNNGGPLPLDIAREAARRGVRIYTIAFGTGENSDRRSTEAIHSPYQIDEKTLREIAEVTGGKYYVATSAGELEKVFTSLPAELSIEEKVQEISVVFAALGALLAAAAIALGQLWHPLP